VRLEGWPFGRGLPSTTSSLSLLPACAGHAWFASVLRAPRDLTVGAALSRFPQARLRTATKWVSTYPRGPRSGSGCHVPLHHHLIGPICPARRHIVISPHGGLYAMPSLCGSTSATRERFRAFTARSFLACRPLRPRGVHHRQFQVSDVGVAFAVSRAARHSQKSAIRFTRAVIFEATWFTQSLRPARLLAPLYGSDRHSSRPTGAFTSRLSTGRSPSLMLDVTATASGLLCWRGFPPRERQLARCTYPIHRDDSALSVRLKTCGVIGIICVSKEVV
jgi:hypothetical protein